MQDSNVAVITGGTGALGRATVPLLIRRGFRIAATYLIPEEAQIFEDEFEVDDERLMLRRVDCTDPAAVGTFMQETAEAFGPINVLCSLVGGWAGGRYVEETDDVRFDRMVDLNLRATFYTVRAAIPHMREVDWGRVIVVSSRTALDPPAGQGAFNIAKAGVLALAKTVAIELDDTHVTCNALLPSVIDTEATRAALPYADYVRWPKPYDIAQVIDFLASPNSEVINGAGIPVYGQS
jgi:NAD(P)-dependent dehydrogenase (short-subunit alcohol dehydrogenase family)